MMHSKKEKLANKVEKLESILRDVEFDEDGDEFSYTPSGDAIIESIEENIEEQLYDTSSLGTEILDIWKHSTDKESVEKLFEKLVLLSFSEWLSDTKDCLEDELCSADIDGDDLLDDEVDDDFWDDDDDDDDLWDDDLI